MRLEHWWFTAPLRLKSIDTANGPRVAVVNEHLAKHYWPNSNAVGKRIRLDSGTGTPVEIVGVAKTIKYRDTFDRGSRHDGLSRRRAGDGPGDHAGGLRARAQGIPDRTHGGAAIR